MSNLRQFVGSTTGLVVCLLLAAVGAYLLISHTGHVLAALPYLALLACPLMHFLHRGHHGHRHHGDPPSRQP
jgi:hypothetical protein